LRETSRIVRVERLQIEGLDEHCRVHPLEEKLDGRVVLVAGKKNEPLSSSRPTLSLSLLSQLPSLRVAASRRAQLYNRL
jgi:hypothetical protein